MITISILGLDQFVVGHYSRNHTENLAQLFETSEDNISFYSPMASIFHNGVEQNSWNVIVRVHAPEKFEALESKAAKYLLQTLKEFTINLSIEFYYYHDHHRYEQINNEYPRFITDENMVNVDDEYDEENEELYEGNIFEGMEERLEAAYKGAETNCECNDECECEECECDEHECHCGHHH